MARDPALQKIIDDAKQSKMQKEAQASSEKIIREETRTMLATIQDEQTKALKPVFEGLAKDLVASVKEAFKNIKVEVPKAEAPQVTVTVPDIHVPEFNIPTPQVTVNVPKSEKPMVTVTPTPVTFPSEMVIKKGSRPFPVMMVDEGGKPVKQQQNQFGGVSGGKGDFFTVLGIQNTVSVVNVDRAGAAFDGTNPLPVTLVSGGSATTASALVDSTGVQYSGSNPLPTSATLTVPTGPGDGASAMRVIHAGDSAASVMSQATGQNETTVGVIRAVLMSDTANSVNMVTLNGNAPAQGLNETTPGVLRAVLMSDTVTSVVVNSFVTSVAATLVDSTGVAYSGSNPLPTTATLSAPVGQGDTASAWRMVHAGDSAASVATQAQGQNETTAGVLRAILMSDTAVSVTSQGQGLNETGPGTLRITHMTDTVDSVNIVTINGSAPSVGTNETTAGVLRVTQMTDTSSSVNVTAFNGNAPAQGLNETVGGVIRTSIMTDVSVSVQGKVIAMTTLPTAVADAGTSFQRSDKYGRALTRPIQVRDLVSTAFVQLTTGTEATLLAASAGKQYDLIWILLSNESTATVQVDLRGVTAGNKVMSFQVPANGTVGIAPPVPLANSSGDTGNNWTVDMPDITGTTVDITALFTQEI